VTVDIAAVVAASRAVQGLPPVVTDPVVLRRLSVLLELRRPEASAARAKSPRSDA
jgi:hypothetical protein